MATDPVIDELTEVVGRLAPPAALTDLARVLALRDLLEARISVSVAALDESGAWAEVGATSMRAWVRDHARCTSAKAGETTRTAKVVRGLPTARAAWGQGRPPGVAGSCHLRWPPTASSQARKRGPSSAPPGHSLPLWGEKGVPTPSPA